MRVEPLAVFAILYVLDQLLLLLHSIVEFKHLLPSMILLLLYFNLEVLEVFLEETLELSLLLFK